MANYYDRYTQDKRWSKVLSVPGRRLQSAEINEIQSIAHNQSKRLGDAVFGAGHVIDGCEAFISQDKKTLKITAGTVYVEGYVYDMPASELAINGVGLEKIGLKITYETITYENDPKLLDPAYGHENFGLPGADRQILNVTWVKDDIDAITIMELQNGELSVNPTPPEFDGFYPILARRTHETNGNFLVSGMEAFIEPYNEDEVYLVIEAGKAYVRGYEVNRLQPTRIPIPKSKCSRRVLNETKVYYDNTEKYPLNSHPVKEIHTLTATVEVTHSITRGNVAGTKDELISKPVVDIVSISQGGSNFVKGTDYRLVGNDVDWLPGGSEPSGGTSYTVKYRYIKAMQLNQDYKLIDDSIEFISTTKPVIGSAFQITYDFYLSRKDLIYLDAQGHFQVIQGQPELTPPLPFLPPDVLGLGEVLLNPNGDYHEIYVTNYKPKRLSMLELRSLLDRLERSEYNQAVLELDREAQIYDPSVIKKGIFTDNFTNFQRADVNHPDFDAVMDPKSKIVMLPVTEKIDELKTNNSTSTVKFHQRLVTMPYVEEVLIDQSAATETWNVNPYMVFGNQATVQLVPSHDSWVDKSVVTRSVSEWWNSWQSGTRTETRLLLEENVPFIRQREVVVIGDSFEPSSDNITATFDGIAVELIPIDGTQKGTQQGTVKADSRGRIKAKFVIPPNVRTGTREVRVFNYV